MPIEDEALEGASAPTLFEAMPIEDEALEGASAPTLFEAMPIEDCPASPS